jgi:hypothetical protein
VRSRPLNREFVGVVDADTLAAYEALPPIRQRWAKRLARFTVDELTALRWVPERPEEHRVWLDEQQRHREWLAACGFGEHHLDFVANDVLAATVPALRFARQFAEGGARALVLTGGPGVGKTLAATWLGWHHGGGGAHLVEANGLYRAAKDDDRLAALEGASLLVIDDLGAERIDDKGWFLSVLDSLVNQVYKGTGRIVITTNLSRLTLAERYGARVESRLSEIAAWARCGAHDLRRHPPEVQ